MKDLLVLSLVFATLGVFAATPAPVAGNGLPNPGKAAPVKKTAAERKSAILRHFGGKIARPRSQQGCVMFLNAQTECPVANIDQIVAFFTQQTGFKITSAKVAPGKPAALKKASGANAAVVIVANDDDPPMLVAPEEGWSLVNVRKLRAGLPDNVLAPKMWETRCRKELIRAFAILCGAFTSPYKGGCLNVARVEDLDTGSEEIIPYDTVQVCKTYMKNLGVTPVDLVFYRTAVKEGWAPAPTNEYQQAAWDKVKGEKERGPSHPIKIAPPKK